MSSCNDFIDLTNFEIQTKIGKGIYSKVYEVVDQKNGKKFVAKTLSDNFTRATRERIIDFSHEVNITSKLNHPSIIKVYGYSPSNFKNKSNPVTIAEYAQNGSLDEILYEKLLSYKSSQDFNPNLDDYSQLKRFLKSKRDSNTIRRKKNILSDTQKLIIIYGVASAMSYLHSHNIVHRGLDLKNIFLDDKFYPKISGFNICREISDIFVEKVSKIKGPLKYLAPEVFKNLEYSKKSDVFSFSLILYELITNETFYKEIENNIESIQKVLENETRPEINESIPECYKKLIEACWSQDPNDRPSFEYIVSLLKTDDGFITEKVNKDEYMQYIKMIEESEITFDSSKNIPHLDELVKLKSHNLNKENFVNLNRGSSPIDTNYDLSVFEDHYVMQNGSFYDICKGYMKDKQERIVKIPVLAIKNFFRHEIVNFHREIKITSRLNHPSIIKFIGYSPIDFNNKPRPAIITEYASSKSLDVIMHASAYKDYWDDTKKLINIYGIAAAMKYLHDHNIIHRDLKPENIISDQNQFPKITGFNISKEIKEKERSHKIKGTPAYIAPEIFKNQEYSKSSDVYSFSLIIYEIMTSQKPYENITSNSINEFSTEIMKNQIRPTFSKAIPKAYKELIERCWNEEPSQRPTFSEIVDTLKTNPNFITETVDEEDFFEYVKFIDEFPISFDSPIKIPQLDEIIESRLHTVRDININACLRGIFDTENSNVGLNFDYFNTGKYEIQRKLKEGNLYNYYILKEKDKDIFVTARVPSIPLRSFNRHSAKNFYRELNILLQLNHPSIVKFLGYSYGGLKSQQTPIIAFEYVSDETLANKRLDDTQKLINIYGIAAAMKYLHDHNIIHRDLKPENIIVDQNQFPKITGFNISKEIKEKERSHKIKGTPAYIAPEIFKNQEYSKSSDVYSFSLIIYEIMTSQKPYENITFNSINEFSTEIMKNQIRPTFPKAIPKAYKELIERCWNEEPSQRPTFSEIVDTLKTNPNFITETVDEAAFLEYVKMIDDSVITFNSNKRINQLMELYKTRKHLFPKSKIKLNFGDIYHTEEFNIFNNVSCLNLDDFTGKRQIAKGNSFKIYKIMHKKSKTLYSAKVSDITLKTISNEQMQNFSDEITSIPNFNHPSIIKFIGYSLKDFSNKPKLVLVNEFASNGSLDKILDLASENNPVPNWNDTKKLINIYGIAFALSYLHSNDFVHPQLEPGNILLDDYLFPKIGFNVYNEMDKDAEQDVKYSYIPPELMESPKATKECNVYSFAIIMYEIITNLKSSQFMNILSIMRGTLPSFGDVNVPDCYKNLIERCWARNPEDRPSFDEIVHELQTNPEFITNKIDKKEYFEYVDYVNEALYPNKSKKHSFEKVLIDFSKIKQKAKLHFTINMESVDLKHYDKLKFVGKGGFGAVYKVENKETKEINAAKVSLYEIDECSKDIILNLSREVDIISRLDYPSILKFIGYNPNNFEYKPKPTIVTEFITNGSLDEVLDLERTGLGIHEWDDTKKLINIYGIAAGMEYLHKHDIIHRDLKPANIFLDDFLYPKIGDFGLSKSMKNDVNIDNDEGNPPAPSGFKGTYAYSAPEILYSNMFSKSSDVYAFGMITYEIMTNEILYEGFNQRQLVLFINDGKRPDFKYSIPYCYRKLIEKCWAQDPNERPTFKEIVQTLEEKSDFITENVDQEEYYDYIYTHDQFRNTDKKKKQTDLQLPQKVSINVSNEIEVEDSLKQSFLDLDKFEKQDLIFKGDFSKVHKITEKETGLPYFAKVSMIKSSKLSRDDIIKLSQEINEISHLYHPSFLKFIGYSPYDFKKRPNSVIFTEYSPNGSLQQVLELIRKGIDVDSWDNTKKLINIYGIASGMSYLHLNDIIHRDLRPENIFLDDYLAPKIFGDFGLSIKGQGNDSITHQSLSGFKGNQVYSAPEILSNNEYSKSSDVYAFAYIVYEILTNNYPFNDISNKNQIYNEVIMNGQRPVIKKVYPECYIQLINRCWSQNPEERPTFTEIVNYLRNEEQFITNRVCKDVYLNYIQMIDNQLASHNSNEETSLDNVSSQKVVEGHEKNAPGEDSINVSSQKIIEEQTANNQKEETPIDKDNDEVSSQKIVEEQVSNNSNEETVLDEDNFKDSSDRIIEEQVSNNSNEETVLDEDNFKDSSDRIIEEQVSNNSNEETVLDEDNFKDSSQKIVEEQTSYNQKEETSIDEDNVKIINEDQISNNSNDKIIVSSQEIVERQILSNPNEGTTLIENDFKVSSQEIVEEQALNNQKEETSIDENNTKIINEDQASNNSNENIKVSSQEIVERQLSNNSNEETVLDEDNFKVPSQEIVERQIPSNSNEGTTLSENDFKVPSQEISEEQASFVIDDKLEIINEYIGTRQAQKLMQYIDSKCDNDTISSIFDKCFIESPDMYLDLCKEGVLIDNAVAHHKYALSLIFNKNSSKEKMTEARNHLETSISKGFNLSYFSLARLSHEVFMQDDYAFQLARDGAKTGEKYSKCLLGHFISHGVGIKKNFKKGIEMMLESGADNLFKKYATDIGMYYAQRHQEVHPFNEKQKASFLQEKNQSNQEEFLEETQELTQDNESLDKKAFHWFEQAYLLRRTDATVNNFGVCFLIGFGVPKDVERAKEIFDEGAEKGFARSLYHLGFIFEKSDLEQSLIYYKKSADKGNISAGLKYNFMKLKE